MNDDLKIKIDVVIRSCRDKEIDVRVSLFNSAEIDYFLEGRSFVALDDRLRVSGPSDIPCNLIQSLEPTGYSPTALKIPANGSLDSGYLSLSSSCSFHGAIPGEYFVIYSTAVPIFTDENFDFFRNNKGLEFLAGSSSFELVEWC